MIEPDDMNILIINLHDENMKTIASESGFIPSPMGEVNEKQMIHYKKLIHNILDTLFYMGYKIEK